MTTGSAFPNPLAGLTELQAATQERQLDIMHALRTQGLLPTRDSLRAQGLPVTALALNRFRSWHHHRQTFQQFDDAGLLVAVLAQRMITAPDPDQTSSTALRFFLGQALLRNDPKTFVLLESLRLQLEKFHFNAAEACLKELSKLRHIATEPRLSPKDKILRVRRLLFGTLPEERKAPA